MKTNDELIFTLKKFYTDHNNEYPDNDLDFPAKVIVTMISLIENLETRIAELESRK